MDFHLTSYPSSRETDERTTKPQAGPATVAEVKPSRSTSAAHGGSSSTTSGGPQGRNQWHFHQQAMRAGDPAVFRLLIEEGQEEAAKEPPRLILAKYRMLRSTPRSRS